jgi:hypothetical protein
MRVCRQIAPGTALKSALSATFEAEARTRPSSPSQPCRAVAGPFPRGRRRRARAERVPSAWARRAQVQCLVTRGSDAPSDGRRAAQGLQIAHVGQVRAAAHTPESPPTARQEEPHRRGLDPTHLWPPHTALALTLALAVQPCANFSGRAPRAAARGCQVDFSKSDATLHIGRAEAELAERTLSLPPATTVRAQLIECTLSAAGARDTWLRGIPCRVRFHDALDIMPRGQEMLCRVGYCSTWDTMPRGTLACTWQAWARRRSACHGTCTARRPSSQTGGSVRAFFSTWAYPAD